MWWNDMDQIRPKLHGLVCYFSPVFGCVTVPQVMPLELAVDYQRAGFAVLVDPADERDLAMYERLERAIAARSTVTRRDPR